MKTDSELKLTNPHAAGIDVGSEHLHTSLRGDPPRVFGTTTGQVHALRDWLKKEGITTVADYSALQLISELGTDLKKHWKNEKHFTSYLGLAPGSHQSGKRKGSQRRSRNRAGRIFCLLARSVGRSVDKALGGFYRRLKARRGGLIANIALARKLAQLYYRMMVHGLEYVEVGLQKYQEQVAQTEFRQLQKLARKHNFNLQPMAAS